MALPFSSLTRSVAASIVLLVGAAALVQLFDILDRPGRITPITRSMDFRAFYCGAKAIGHGDDPYRVRPILSCQNEASDEFKIPRETNAVPAPLPPYALFVISPIAQVPFRVASPTWAVVLFSAFIFCTATIRRFTGYSTAPIFFGLFFSLLLTALGNGQFGPILVSLVLLNVIAIRRQHSFGVAASAWGMAIEPHVGLASLLGCFLYVPKARKWLLLGSIAVVALSFISGPTYTIEYVSTVLPLHGLSQLSDYKQYSLTTLLWTLGVPTRLSLTFGTLSYVVMLALGLFLAARLRLRDQAYIGTVPVAFAVIGGTFIHLAQIAVALPLAFMLLSAESKVRRLAIVAVIALALPVQTLLDWSGIQHDFYKNVTHVARNVTPYTPSPDTDPIIESTYAFGEYAGSITPGTGAKHSLIPRMPTWLGLISLLIATTILTFQKESLHAKITSRRSRDVAFAASDEDASLTAN